MAAATLLTAVTLLGLNLQRAPRKLGPAEERVVYFPVLQALPLRVQEGPGRQVPGESRPTERTVRQRPSIALPRLLLPVPAPASVATTVEPLVEPASTALVRPSAESASAPIRLDPSVLRDAHRASKSEVRKLAEASGASFGDEPVSGSGRLAAAVHHAKKPDCLAPSGGGSLLSVFVVAYMAVNDQCK